MALPRHFVRKLVGTVMRCVPLRLLHAVRNLAQFAMWSVQSRGFAAVGQDCYLRGVASIHNPSCIRLGDAVASEPGLILEAFIGFREQAFQPRIHIGNRVSFGYDCHVGCIDSVTIGDDVLIASRVFISDHGHGNADALSLALPPVRRPLASKGPVHIGARVWIGEGVCILSGVTIGDDAVIGANSVVTSDVPPGAVFAGTPARPIQQHKKQGMSV